MERLVQERIWMYNQRVPGRSYNSEAFLQGVRMFVETAIAKGYIFEGRQMRCPCSKCKNRKFHEVDSVENHLYTNGFVKEYYNWTLHGECIAEILYCPSQHTSFISEANNETIPPIESDQNHVGSRFADMVHDMGESSSTVASHLPEELNDDANQFYELLKSSQNPAFEGCTSETELSIAMKLLQTKIDHGISEAAYDSLCEIISRLLDCANNVPTSFRQTKKLVSDLGMGYVRIDVCVKGCMIFYQQDESLIACRFCGESRFKQSRYKESSKRYTRIARSQMFYLPIIPRLKRLFMVEFTAANMSWHSTKRSNTNTMVHPSDGQSWKYFDECYPEFARETRNVRLGLSADGFSPFGMSSKSYSCCPVMLTPYNFPPWMCMKTRVMWLTVVIPGPRDPTKRIDIYLKPLIEDLLTLWDSGVHTYDAYHKQNFLMRAALMWTISDFPAYAMLSGWSTRGYGIETEGALLDIYKRLKVMPDGTFLETNGQQIVEQLEERYNQRLQTSSTLEDMDDIEDVETFTQIVGLTSRDKLPRVLGAAASLVEGTKYTTSQRMPATNSQTTLLVEALEVIKKLCDEFLNKFEERITQQYHAGITKEVLNAIDARLEQFVSHVVTRASVVKDHIELQEDEGYDEE